ncbi:MAG: ABC transporter substrate-binding protein [Anaerolineae bacterium]
MKTGKERSVWILVAALAAFFCLICVCVIGAGSAGYLFFSQQEGRTTPSTATIAVERPTPLPSMPKGRGELRLAAPPPETLDPALAGDLDSAQYVNKLFSGLVSLDEELRVQPELAEGWEVSEDGRVYTFHLRRDARFHDGRPITAEDFRYSLERSCDPATESTVAEAYLGDIVGVRARLEGEAQAIRGVEVLDDYTLRLTTDEPKSYFLSKLTYSTAFAVDKQQAEGDPDWLRHPNGSGPFQLAGWTDDTLVLEPSPYYPGETPRIGRVVFHLAPTGSPMTMYETGELDAVLVPVDQIERVRDPANPLNRELEVIPLLDTFYVGLNVNAPPFDDPKVRRAFALALNREGIVKVLLRGQVEMAQGILPPGMPGYNPNLEGIPYDPDQARELLAQSRYGGADQLPPVTLTTGGSGQMGEVLAEMWADALGVEMQVEVPVDSMGTAWKEGRLQMVLLGWIADYPDPENFLDLLFHSRSAQNGTGYSNPEVDELLEQARAEPDPEKRFRLYQRAEERIVMDVPWIPLYHDVNYLLVKPYVNGLTMTPQGLYDLRRVRVQAR